MSHFTTVKTKICDVQALEAALADLEFRILHNTAVRGWGNSYKKADLVAQARKCPFDIGFIRNAKTDGYDMVADWWGIHNATGVDQQDWLNRITQRYAYHKVLKEVQKQGFMIAEDKIEQDQSIRLVVRKW